MVYVKKLQTIKVAKESLQNCIVLGLFIRHCKIISELCKAFDSCIVLDSCKAFEARRT